LAGALDSAFLCGWPCAVEIVTGMTAMAPLAFLGTIFALEVDNRE
jgi:hypothetical protein